MSSTRKVFKIVFINFFLLVVGILIACAVGEFRLRSTHGLYEAFETGWEKPWFRDNANKLTDRFMVDPEFGFRPVLDGKIYTKFGAKVNDYALEKPSGVERVLFVGDSVTARQILTKEIRKMYSEERFEFWNAGVDSFNTLQEVQFYKKYNAQIQPDRVVLIFHNNDFETTPVTFVNEKNELVLYSPYIKRDKIIGWLFEKSLLYRKLLGMFIERNAGDYRKEIKLDVLAGLKELTGILSEQGIEFSVIIFPLLKPLNQWTEGERANYLIAVEFMKRLNVTYYDLIPTLLAILKDGIDPQEDPGDTWHPSPEASRYFAKFLFSQGFLPDKL